MAEATGNVAINLFERFATNPTKEAKGAQTYIPGFGDTKFTVARQGPDNVAYSNLLNKRLKKDRAALESEGETATKVFNKLMAEVMGKTILLGWEGKVLWEGGAELAYSEENAIKILTVPEVRKRVQAVAENYETFLAKQEGEDVKN